MTVEFRLPAAWRWILAALASAGAFFAALWLSLFVFFFSPPFPRSLAEPTAGFFMGSIIVLTGSIAAPRCRLTAAVVLFVFGVLPLVVLMDFHYISALVGGLISVAFVAWWFDPHRSARATRRAKIGASLAFFAFIFLVYSRYVDMPARTDQLPSELNHALGTNASRVSGFYEYDLGGFIDAQWLWRIDAKPDIVALIVAELGLQRTNTVPQRFWRMPPHYWPRSMPASAEAFQSEWFVANDRGRDGNHFFLLQDKSQDRTFVWFKSNF